MLYGAERVAQQKARYGALLDRHEAQCGTKEEVWFCSAPWLLYTSPQDNGGTRSAPF